MTQPPDEVYGAAAERTSLAWQRTALGVVVSSFLIFHTAFGLGLTAIGLIALLLGLAVATLSVFVIPMTRFLRGAPADSWRLLSTTALVVTGLGVLGAVAGLAALLAG